jgi:hypothetical protein
MHELIDRADGGEAHRVPLLFVHGIARGAWCWDEHFLSSSHTRVTARWRSISAVTGTARHRRRFAAPRTTSIHQCSPDFRHDRDYRRVVRPCPNKQDKRFRST